MADRDLNRLAERFLQDLAARTQAATQPMGQRAMVVPNQAMPTPRAQDLFNQMMARRQQTPVLPPMADPASAMQMMQDQSRASMLAQAADDPANPVQVVPNVTAPVPPQYISSPNLRIRGNPDDPAQQTRQYAAPLPQAQPPAVQPGPGVTGGTFTPQQAMDMFLNSPAAQTMDPAAFASAYANLYRELTTTQSPPTPQQAPPPAQQQPAQPPPADPYASPPPGVNLTPQQWAQMTIEQRQAAWQAAGNPNGAQASPTQRTASPPPGVTIPQEQWDKMTPEQKDAAWQVYYNPALGESGGFDTALNRGWTNLRSGFNAARESPPGQVVEKGVNTAVKIAGWAEHENQKQMADATYYMMTHNGELPSDFGDPGTYVARYFGTQPDLTDVQLAMPPEGSGLTYDEWINTPRDQQVLIYQQAHSDNPMASLTMLTYLQEHPEQWDAAKRAYEAGGSEGLFTWYTETVGPWWSFGSSLIMDPLNWALGLGVAGKGLKGAALARSMRTAEEVASGVKTAEEGQAALRAAKAMSVGGEVLKAAGDPLSYPFEQLWKSLGWGARRLPGAGYGRAATEQTTTEGVQEGADIIRAGQGSEEEFARYKNEAAAAQNQADAAARAAEQRRAASIERRDAQMKGRRSAGNQPTPPPPGSTLDSVAQRQAEYDSWAAKAEERIAKRKGGPATDPMSTTELMAERDVLQAADTLTPTQANRLKKINATIATRTDAEQVAADLARAADQAVAQPTVDSIFDGSYRLDEELPTNVQQAIDDNANTLSSQYLTEANVPIRDVPTDAKIVATQADFVPEKLQSYIDNPNLISETADVPIAVFDGDTYYLIEGTNRTGAARIRGDGSIQMRVIDATPAPTTGPRISVDTTRTVARGGQLVDEPITHSYLDASYANKQSDNLARFIDETYGASDPAALERFRASYDPLAKEQMLREEEIRNATVRKLHAEDTGVTPTRLNTPESTLVRAGYDAQAEALVDLHFNRRSPINPRRFDTRAGRMSPTDPRSWIEHALLGDNEADHAAAIAKIRGRTGQIMADATDPALRISNETLANALERRWRELVGEAPGESLSAAAEQVPFRDPNAPVSFADLPDSVQQDMEMFRERIQSADPDVSRRAARTAHNYQLPSDLTAAEKKAWHDEVSRLRDETPHPKSGKRGPGTVGIINDPADAASQLYNATRAKIGQGIRKIIKDPLSPADEAKEATIYVHGLSREKIKNPDELLDMITTHSIPQRQVDVLLEPRIYTRAVNGVDETVTTNVWNRYQERLEPIVKKRETRLAKEGFPTTEEGVADLRAMMAVEHETALTETIRDLTPKGHRDAAIARNIKKVLGANRSILQFNVVTGPKAVFKDVVGNLQLATIAGEAGSARYVPDLMWTFVKDDLDEVQMINHPLFSGVKESGISFLPTDISHTVGREEVARNVTKRGKIPNPLSSYWIKRIRNSNDNAFRHAIYLNKFGEELPYEQGKFLDFVRSKTRAGKAPQAMEDEVSRLITERFNAGRSFSPEEIRTITKKYVTDDSYARTWAKQVDDLSARANKAQRTVMFTYKKTKIDDAISKVFLFHYYMTRSSALYVKLMLQHPQLITMEHEIWKASQASLNDYPGTPTWMKGFVAFGLGDGHVLYTNPFQFVSRIAAFQGIGDGGYSQSRIEEILNSTGLFMNPMWKTALAIIGEANAGNPFGTGQIEKMVINAIDQIRFSDFGREHGWDKANNGLPTPNLAQDIVNGIVDAANAALRDLNAPISDFKAADSNSRSRQAIMDILVTNAQQDDWDADRLAAAQNALLMGEQNDDVDAAIEEYTNLNMASSAGNALIPSDAYVQDAATNQRKEEVRQAKDVPYDQRTPEQASQVAAQDIASIQSAEGQSLQRGMNDYNAAGSLSEQQIQDGMNQITLGYDEIPDWWTATIGGKTYSGSDIKNMTDEERQDLAYQWAAEQQTEAGIAVGAKVSGPDYLRDNPNASLAGKREQVRAEHPEIDDYLTFRSWSYKDEVDVPTTITKMLAVGDTEFSRAYHRHEDYLRSQGVKGPALQAEMEQWFRSPESYAAMQGWQWKDRADPGAPLFNINNLPPWQEDVGTAADTSEKKANQAADNARLRGPVEDVGSFIRDRARQYNQDQFPWRRKEKKTGATSGTGSPLSYLLKDYIG